MLPKQKMLPAVFGRAAWLALIAVLLVLVWVPAALPARKPILCTLAPGQSSLAPATRHGLAAHLRQYPDLTLATPPQLKAANRLLERARTATARWGDLKAANASGFDTHLA